MQLLTSIATTLVAQETRGPSSGDNCCFGIFDWGCTTYYKNVFNPADKRGNGSSSANSSNVGLPGSSSANSSRPQQYNHNTDFYSLPPAVELTPTMQLQQGQMQSQEQGQGPFSQVCSVLIC